MATAAAAQGPPPSSEVRNEREQLAFGLAECLLVYPSSVWLQSVFYITSLSFGIVFFKGRLAGRMRSATDDAERAIPRLELGRCGTRRHSGLSDSSSGGDTGPGGREFWMQQLEASRRQGRPPPAPSSPLSSSRIPAAAGRGGRKKTRVSVRKSAATRISSSQGGGDAFERGSALPVSLAGGSPAANRRLLEATRGGAIAARNMSGACGRGIGSVGGSEGSERARVHDSSRMPPLPNLDPECRSSQGSTLTAEELENRVRIKLERARAASPTLTQRLTRDAGGMSAAPLAVPVARRVRSGAERGRQSVGESASEASAESERVSSGDDGICVLGDTERGSLLGESFLVPTSSHLPVALLTQLSGENRALRDENGKLRRRCATLETEIARLEEEHHTLAERAKPSRCYAWWCSPLVGMRSIVVLSVTIAAAMSFNLGYDIGIMSGAKRLIVEDWDLSDGQMGIMVGIVNICAGVGALFSGMLVDSIGRKNGIGLACIVSVAAALVQAAAPDYALLMIGRVLSGISIGASGQVAPLYIAELVPAENRGKLLTSFDLFINIGAVLGFIVGALFSGLPPSAGWRVMLALGGGPPLCILFALPNLAESPRWLLSKGRTKRAKEVLHQVYPPEKAKAELRQLSEDLRNTPQLSEWQAARRILRPETQVQKQLMKAAMGTMVISQITGIEAAVNYTPETLETLGITGEGLLLGITVAVGMTKTIFILVAARFIDKTGRVPLLVISNSGMAISQLFIAVGIASGALGLALAGQFGFMAAFSLGNGPIPSMYASECFAPEVRGFAMGVATCINRLTAGLVSTLFPFIKGAPVFFVFAFICAYAAVWSHRCMPETKGRTLEEITGKNAPVPAERRDRRVRPSRAERSSSAKGSESRRSSGPSQRSRAQGSEEETTNAARSRSCSSFPEQSDRKDESSRESPPPQTLVMSA